MEKYFKRGQGKNVGPSLSLSLISDSVRMKLMVRCLVLFSLAALVLAQLEVSTCGKQCGDGCKCPCAAAATKPFMKYTKMKGKGKNKKPVANAQCTFDPTMGKTCGQCMNGGKQCGPPMHKWCQNPKAKNVG